MTVSFPSAASATEVVADLAFPDAPGSGHPFPVVLLAHGGGWQLGSRTDYAQWTDLLMKAGFATLSVDYTLARAGAPSWPSAAADVGGAFHFLRESGPGLGIDASRVACFGTSAGAHLLATVVLSEDTGCRGAVLVNGVYDLASQYDYSASRGPRNAVAALLGAAPATMPQAVAAGSPTLLAPGSPRAAATAWTIVYGEDDPIVPPVEQSGGFAAALRAAGAAVRLVGVPDAAHHWNTTTPVDEGPNLVIRDLVLARLAEAVGLPRSGVRADDRE